MGFNKFYRDGLQASVVGKEPKPVPANQEGFWTEKAGKWIFTLYFAETNRLFWEKTGYKIGEKLNPSDPKDIPYIKVWMTIYNQLRIDHKATPTTKADAHAKVAADETQKSIDATKAGDPVKATEHATKADEHAVEALKEMAPPVPATQALARLSERTFSEAKRWLLKKPHGRFFGWGIRKDGLVFTKETDSETEINDWFGNLGLGQFAGTLYALYWDDQHKDASGVVIPVQEFTPTISATDLSNALDAAEAPPTPPSDGGGGGGSLGAALGLGLVGALGLLVVANSKAKH